MNGNTHPFEHILADLTKDVPKRYAVARLVGYCEGIANSGILGETVTSQLRAAINETVVAFDMPVREKADVDA